MESRGFIINSFAIMTVLTMVSLSQLVFFRPMVKNTLSQMQSIKNKIPYANAITEWAESSAYDPLGRVSGEVADRANQVQQEIVEQKNILQKNSMDTVKKAAAKKILSTLGLEPQDLIDQTTFCPQ